MTIKFTNNAETLLSTSSLADDDTSVAVDDGSVFPALSSGEFFYATLIRADALTTREIVKVTARSGNTLTIVRAQDNTSALTFSADDLIELRIVAATLESLKAADELTTGDAAVTLSTSAGNITIDAQGNDTDIILKGTDGSSDTTFLTIDGSDAGKATFNNEIVSGAVITSGAGLVIANAGNIGSVSDTDAIAIASNGVVTFSQIPVLPADTVALDDIATGDAAATLATTTGNITIDATANDSDIIFKGTDNTSDITMLTLDGSEAGAATFNDKIIATELDISGNIDIDGTANLDAVDIDGAVQIDSTVTVGVNDTGYDVKFFGDTASAYMLWDTSTDDLVLAGAAGLVIPDDGTIGSASDTDAIAIRSDGNIGIGVVASDTKQVYVYDNTTTDQLLSLYQANAGNGQAGIYLTKEGTGIGIYGQVNLGTSSAIYGHHNGDSSNVGIGTRGHSVSGYGVYGRTGSTVYGGVIGFSASGSNYGILGHGNTHGLYATSVYCIGTLFKGVDNFRIKHGLREGYDLFHSVIEGPQADLIYRGKVELVNGQASIDIDSYYDMTPGTFVWLTKSDSVQTFTSNETGWDAVRSSFSGDTITIECQNSSSTDTISWMVIAERGDPTFRESEVTDDDGNMILERESEPPPPPPPEG
jgi:hypothetical protein